MKRSKLSNKNCSTEVASLFYGQVQREEGKELGHSNTKIKKSVPTCYLFHLKPVRFYHKDGQTTT